MKTWRMSAFETDAAFTAIETSLLWVATPVAFGTILFNSITHVNIALLLLHATKIITLKHWRVFQNSHAKQKT